ncbi:MAG: aminotransferase class V-fold PLP-dependent enzyme [Polyangiales bacterium]
MIYLDHHATTPLCVEAKDAIRAALESELFNASSIHRAGRHTRARIENARSTIANAAGALAKELVFTSGGTEALHLAVHCAALTEQARRILLDPGAHPALLAACERTAKSLGATVERLRADRWGRIDVDAMCSSLEASEVPTLVAATWVQHETGTITPLRRVIDEARARRAATVLDAVQALGKIPVDLGSTGAVCAALSAHKIGGPTGVGAAWIRQDQRARALIDGGGQERGVRAGTENTLGIIAFGAAAGAIDSRLSSMESLGRERDRFESSVRECAGFSQTVRDVERVATAAHFLVDDVAGEEIVAALDLDGICVSSGPACSSGRSGLSESLLAMFGDAIRSKGALRISLSPATSRAELDRCAAALVVIAERMQRFR